MKRKRWFSPGDRVFLDLDDEPVCEGVVVQVVQHDPVPTFQVQVCKSQKLVTAKATEMSYLRRDETWRSRSKLAAQ